eukprot:9036931-Heterocapsa_arctica.AAC.1
MCIRDSSIAGRGPPQRPADGVADTRLATSSSMTALAGIAARSSVSSPHLVRPSKRRPILFTRCRAAHGLERTSGGAASLLYRHAACVNALGSCSKKCQDALSVIP